MQAYRTHSVVHNGQVVVQLPEGFENTDVEIIVLKASTTSVAKPGKKGKFKKYRGILKTGLTLEEIDTQLKALREEWERPDAVIAATAIVHDFTLISRNDEDFRKIPGLKYLNPFTDL